MKVGIIGYGGFGRFLHSAWSALPAVDVVALADPQVRLPEGVRGYRSPEALLEDAEVEVVSICTPPATHAPLACAALARGKHVLVEKPLATTLAGADAIIRAAGQAGRVVGINYVMRYTPIAEQLLAWSRAGTFGPLRRVTVENEAQDEALPADHWFWQPEVSGGILVEHAVHFIDLIDACAGRGDASVSGTALRRADGRLDRMAIQVQYGDRLLASQYHAFTRPKLYERTRWHFGFEALEMDADGWIPLSGSVRALVGEATREALQRLPGFAAEREEALASPAVVGGTPHPATHLVTGRFAVEETKDAIYRRGVQQALLDVVQAVQQPGHGLRVSLAEARRSLAFALQATQA